MLPDLSHINQFKEALKKFIEGTARKAVSEINTFRAQQVQNPTDSHTTGTVIAYNSPLVTVRFADGYEADYQIGNRWLDVGDIAIVYGGVAN